MSEMSDYKKAIASELIRLARDKYGDNNMLFVVPKYAAKSFHSYCSMKEDLQLMKKYLDLLESNGLTDEIKSSLMYSTIALYGKCFTDASKAKAPKLEAKKLSLSTQETLTHEYLMELRHRFIAHRGETDSEIESAFFLINNVGTNTELRFMRIKQVSFTEKQISDIKDHFEKLDGELDLLIEKTAKKVQTHLLSFDPELMKNLNINNIGGEE